ncbi:glycine betaine ABC transporter substrate-binding protein [Pontibacillus marinus]|uniref:Substrate-binding region of ABC glycine betaine transporter n=1 Tax=Pontibacillus marinus BH030004 = DSM 16465 TaxID=1385511 RepID=A0A0A5GFJ0_9BACI|nr:glycine betaine ABC transporter substrate-binding protein [Pontibacillus marinus]KGX90779.1 substrate-binding region of ABC glycine betaine transporter [Pontibacillus marinus BH030004 = DSM 16465]
MKKLLFGSLVGMMLLMSACGNSKQIEIGTQTYTDPKIMAHIIETLIEDRTDLEVNITKDIAASPQIISSMEKGDLDIAATLFSGEVYNNHFDDLEFTTDPEETMKKAQEGFKEKYNFKWYDSIGFENAYAIAVSQDIVEQYDPQTISDLKPISDKLRFGTDTSWLERPNDGYRAFKKKYDMSFKEARGMEVRLMYEAIENDELDVITAYTVDPQIRDLNMKILEDNKNFFPPYDASVVATQKVLEEHPKVDKVLQELIGSIDTETMSGLIKKVDIEGKEAKKVAENYLKEQGYLE